MKKENLSLYKCPLTGGELELLNYKGEDEIYEGVLYSKKAKKNFFIKDKCVDFITPEQEIKGAAFARKYYSEIAKTYDENVHITFDYIKKMSWLFEIK